MAINYGNNVAKYVTQGSVSVGTGGWIALRVGSTNQANRFALRIFVRSNPGMSLALAYANAGRDANEAVIFTTPTRDVRQVTIYPGGRTWIEPVGENVTVYGRLVKKAGATDSSVKVVLTEFS